MTIRPLQRALLCTLALALPAAAWATPILGSAQSFTVLGGSTVTNTGLTNVVGDIGVAPGTAITGLTTATQDGAVHSGDSAAASAHLAAAAADAYLSSLVFTHDLTGQDLGGMTLTPGVYRISSAAQLTGTLTLDAQNMAAALFVFQIGTTLTTAAASSVDVINGSADTGVFFGVGTSAVLGVGSQFAGNLIATDSITFDASATLLCGRALALNGAVTLDSNKVSNDCAAGSLGGGRVDYASLGFSGNAATEELPEPASALLWSLGFGALAWARKRRAA